MVIKFIYKNWLPLLFSIFLIIFSISMVFYPILSIISFFSILLFLYIYINPLLGLFFTVIMVPFSNIGIIFDAHYRSQPEYIYVFIFIPVFMTLISYFLNSLNNPQRFSVVKIESKNINILIFLLISWFAISLIWTIDIYKGIHKLISIIVCITMLFLFEKILIKKDDILKLLNIFPIFGIALCLLLFWSKAINKLIIIDIISYHIRSILINIEPKISIYFAILVAGVGEKMRPGGFAYPNEAANILSLFIFIDIALLYAATKFKRVLLIAHIVLLTIGLVMTSSKGGFAGFMVGLITFSFIVPQLRYYSIRIFNLFILLFIIINSLTDFVVIKRLYIAFTSIGIQSFIKGRFTWWSKGFKVFWDSYGVGIGGGGFPKLIDPIPMAHSFYISILPELGIIGVMLIGLIIFIKLKEIIKSISIINDSNFKFISYSMLCSLISFFVYGLSDIDYAYFPFWLFLGLTTSVVKTGISIKVNR